MGQPLCGHRIARRRLLLVQGSRWTPVVVRQDFWTDSTAGFVCGSLPGRPGPVKIALPALRYSTTAAAASGLWCLQVHNGSALLKGLLRNVDMSRGVIHDASLGDVTP